MEEPQPSEHHMQWVQFANSESADALREMKALSSVPSEMGAYTSVTSMNFSSVGPSSARPAARQCDGDQMQSGQISCRCTLWQCSSVSQPCGRNRAASAAAALCKEREREPAAVAVTCICASTFLPQLDRYD